MTPAWLSAALLDKERGFFPSAVGHPEFTLAGDKCTFSGVAPSARAAMLLEAPPPPPPASSSSPSAAAAAPQPPPPPLRWRSAPQRAAEAVLSGEPHRLLFAGMTFLLLGAWETPPGQVSRRQAAELLAAGGGRLLDTDFSLVPAGATPSGGEFSAARARVLACGLAEGGGRQAMLDAVGEGPPPSAGADGSAEPPPPTPAEDLAVPWGTEAREWRTTLFALACLPLEAAARGRGVAPPLVVLCDAPGAPLPPPLRALLALREPPAPRAAVLTPQWLLDCAATYTLLDPLTRREAAHVHAAFLQELGAARE